MLKIVTGKTGTPHVTSADDRFRNAGIFGRGMYVLDTGNKLSATKTSSNTVKVRDGDLFINGTHARIAPSEDETVTIQGGTSGLNRIDLIVAQYRRAGGVESVSLKVLQGVPTSGTPQQPQHYEGDILAGATTVDMPLYSVLVNGVDVQEPVQLFSIKKPLSEYFDLIYPIGSIYINYYANVNPADIFGGRWERFAQGRTLIGVGTGASYGISRTFPENTVGGEYVHQLTEEEMPMHKHKYDYVDDRTTGTSLISAPDRYGNLINKGIVEGQTKNAGSSKAFNVVQPYITVYMWRRIG